MKKKRKQGGFTLIELVVAVALIGMLSTLVTPRVREQLAKGRDTRAIALLGAMRTASELYYIEKGEAPLDDISQGGNAVKIKESIGKLMEYLDPKANDLLKDGEVEIGGTRKKTIGAGGEAEASKEINFGGNIGFTFLNPDTTATNRCDGVYIWFSSGAGKEYDTGGKLWEKY